MSHFTTIECDFDQKCEKSLIEALEEQFGKGHVEVHDEGASLYGYNGDNRSILKETNPNYAPNCHIIIRKKHVGSAANDIGYRRLENGKYAAYISEYDVGSNFTKNKQHEVAKNYAVGAASSKLIQKGWSVSKQWTKAGQLQLVATKWGKA